MNGTKTQPHAPHSANWLRLIMPLSFISLAIGFAVQLPGIDATSNGDILGPRWMPTVAVGALLLSGGADLVRTFRINNDPAHAFDRSGLLLAVILLIATAAYVTAMAFLGYALASGIFFIALFYWISSQGLVRSIWKGIGLTAVLVAVFHFVLGISLPTGPLGGFL